MSEGFREKWYSTADVMPEGADIVPCVALDSILQNLGISHLQGLS